MIIKEEELAKEEALLEYPEDLVIFTDGANKERAGAGLVWQLPYRADLHQRSIPLGEGKEALDAELYAIKEGLLIAQKEARRPEISSIRIFTDFQKALKLIQKSSIEGLDILLEIRNITVDLLKAEKPLILHWTLGHKNVPRNELADQAVKEAAQYTSRVDSISLLYTKKRI